AGGSREQPRDGRSNIFDRRAPSPFGWKGGTQHRRPKKVIVLSGSKFWARGRYREQESETADGGLAGALTAMDRCDRCGVQAYVRALLPNGLELLFCAHHNRQHSSALAKI